MGSHSVTCHPTQVNRARLKPSQTGRYPCHKTAVSDPKTGQWAGICPLPSPVTSLERGPTERFGSVVYGAVMFEVGVACTDDNHPDCYNDEDT